VLKYRTLNSEDFVEYKSEDLLREPISDKITTMNFWPILNVTEVSIAFYNDNKTLITAQIEVLGCQEKPKCNEEDLLDNRSTTIAKVINETGKNLSPDNISSERSLKGWSPSSENSYLEIHLSVMYLINKIEILQGSNMMSFRMIFYDNNNNSLSEREYSDMTRDHMFIFIKKNLKIIRLIPKMKLNPLMLYNIKFRIYGCSFDAPSTSSVISTSETTVIPTTVTVPTPNQQICFESEILENQ